MSKMSTLKSKEKSTQPIGKIQRVQTLTIFGGFKKISGGYENIFGELKKISGGYENIFGGLKKISGGYENIFGGLKKMFKL